jgi:hypothetical protein
MKQKIFLTSALAMGMFAPAFAEMTDSNTFPDASQGEYMQENTRYIGAATADNMDSVYEGEVNAIAEYTEIPYSAAEGFYLTGVDNNNDAITAECTSGNFCPGVASTTYENNAFGNTGLQSCSTATSGAYTLSDAGASSSDQCYRTCSGNVTILHATGVTGNDYSDGTNTCAPTGCENGWHVKSGNPDLTTIIGTGAGASRAYTNSSGSFSEELANYGASFYNIENNDVNAFAVNYENKGILHGHAACSTTPGTANWAAENSTFSTSTSITDQSGQEGARYCWCHLDGYTPYNSMSQSLTASWVINSDSYGVSDCASDCAGSCAYALRADDNYSLAFRSAVLDTVPFSLATCEANTITIRWGDTDLADVTANNAGTATYGSDIRTPVKAQTIKGKTFRGWRFSVPEQTNLSE